MVFIIEKYVCKEALEFAPKPFIEYFNSHKTILIISLFNRRKEAILLVNTWCIFKGFN